MEHVLSLVPKPTITIDGSLFSPASAFPTVGSLVSILLKNVLVVAGIVCLVLLIFGGFGFIVSAGGDSKKLDKGKQTITGAITGLILIIAAYWIIQLIEKITGVPILAPNL